MSEEQRRKKFSTLRMKVPLTRPRPLHESTISNSIAFRNRCYDQLPIDDELPMLAQMIKDMTPNEPLDSGGKRTPLGLLPYYKEPEPEKVERPWSIYRPRYLFEASLSALNNFCGSVCRKLQLDHKHELPYIYRSGYRDDLPFIMRVYKIEVLVLDYIFSVVRLEGTGRENMADLAHTLIRELISLEETLRIEHLDEKKVWQVKDEDMLNYLVEPCNKFIFRRGKEEISIMHNSLSMCVLHVLPSPKPAADKGVSSGSVGSCS